MFAEDSASFQYPFGEESCEHEIEVLQENYQLYYYERSRFNKEALDRDAYLVVGRRGAGKTSLGKYFEFQDLLKNAKSIDVDEPEVYSEVLAKIIAPSGYYVDVSVAQISKIWEYAIWRVLVEEYKDEHPQIQLACLLDPLKKKPAYLIKEILRQLLSKVLSDPKGGVAAEVDNFLSSAIFEKARQQIFEITRKYPVIVAIDTLERYDRNDEALMKTTAALIQCANGFNIAYARQGIHVKAFISAEIFPHLKESSIPNTTKFIRNPVYLHWTPKDLARLICWRFHRSLEISSQAAWKRAVPVDWDNFEDVLKKMWYPHFGEQICNGNGLWEKSFPYIMRHTQMRPRQLVVLCNQIARKAVQAGCYPFFKKLDIAEVIRDCERGLADEVLNSYALIYPRVAEITDALHTFPMLFPGRRLDRFASNTSSAWPDRQYSPANFRQLVAELGIVGRVRSYDEKRGIVAADFEYNQSDRLALLSSDLCVIHPMFYSKMQVVNCIDEEDFKKDPRIEQLKTSRLIVYPFPNHPDYSDFID